MEHYVTLFDENFLPQGLALYDSLCRHARPFKLWVLCMDEATRRTIGAARYEEVETIGLAEVEGEELLRVKPTRNRAEYCWTLTPFAPTAVFARDPTARRVTYVDADMFLLASPEPIFDEFEASGKAVQITEHAYEKRYDRSSTSGIYCVQFMTFVRDACEPVRGWWEERCLEWCFGRFEDGKFGDQKYLDDWPERFPEHVHVLSRKELLQAPWNGNRFSIADAVAWHFHGLRLLPDGRVILYRHYRLPQATEDAVYVPYVAALRRHAGHHPELSAMGDAQAPGFADRLVRGVMARLRGQRVVGLEAFVDGRTTR